MKTASAENILFQGDSLTDASRDKEEKNPQMRLGIGYVYLISGCLMSKNPSVHITNRGVNGDRIMDLYARWIEDTLNEDFDLLSILCGVNDVGFQMRMNRGADEEKFYYIYNRMLYEVRKEKPNAKIVLCEPFLFRLRREEVEDGTDIIDEWNQWYGQIKKRAGVVRKLAREYNALLIPSLELFEQACKKAPASHWSTDGVHLTLAGNALLAKEWLKCVREAKYVLF